MGRRYYRRYNRSNRSYSPSIFDMFFEMVMLLIIWLTKLVFKLVYRLFSLVIEKIYKTHVDKKASPFIQEETQPLPETHFTEEEEEKEIYLPYRKKSFLLTKTEYAFDKVLTEAVQDKYYIGRQVPLSSIIEVTTTYKPYRSKIDKKTIDFVLFNKAGYTPYLAIELDDPSHLRMDRIERDRFVEEVLHKADIRLKRIKTAYSYNPEEIAEVIK